MPKALTNAAIRTAKVGETFWDEKVTGLHLRALPTKKAFYLTYRTKTGKQRVPKLGDQATMTLDQARTLATDWLLEVRAGKDPSKEFSDGRTAPTVAELWPRFDREHLSQKKEKTRVDVKWAWKEIIKPAIGALKAGEVDYNAMSAMHLSNDERPVAANRALAHASVFFNALEKWGLRAPGSNPCRFVSRFPETKRRRVMTAEEAPRIAAALLDHEEAGPASVAFIRLLMFSGARCDEIARIRWDWMSPEGDRAILPDSKTGQAIVYFPPLAQEVIKSLPRTNGTLTGIQSPKTVWEKVRIAAGCPDLCLHDLRRSFASAALSNGVSLSQVGELLNHSSAQTTKNYAYLFTQQAHSSAEVAANAIGGLLSPPKKAA